MCGISGIVPLSKDITDAKILEVMEHLLLKLRTRGGDSTGIASWGINSNKIIICKQADEAKDFIDNLQSNNLVAVANQIRDYPLGNFASHIIGYTNEVTQDELNKDPTSKLGDLRGRSGLESEYDQYLKGKSGEIRFDRNAGSSPVIIDPTSGASLVTSIDGELENLLGEELKKALAF